MYVVLLLGGYDLPQAFGPFDDIETAGAFAQTCAAVDEPCVVEVESPATIERS